jgi:FlaA1/EpsC-like NDP-sugar epimerase
MESGKPGELHIPKLPSYRLRDLAGAYMMEHPQDWAAPEVIGLRASEKKHELLISSDEAESVLDGTAGHYVLQPGKVVSPGCRMCFSSETAQRLSIEELRGLIRGA